MQTTLGLSSAKLATQNSHHSNRSASIKECTIQLNPKKLNLRSRMISWDSKLSSKKTIQISEKCSFAVYVITVTTNSMKKSTCSHIWMVKSLIVRFVIASFTHRPIWICTWGFIKVERSFPVRIARKTLYCMKLCKNTSRISVKIIWNRMSVSFVGGDSWGHTRRWNTNESIQVMLYLALWWLLFKFVVFLVFYYFYYYFIIFIIFTASSVFDMLLYVFNVSSYDIFILFVLFQVKNHMCAVYAEKLLELVIALLFTWGPIQELDRTNVKYVINVSRLTAFIIIIYWLIQMFETISALTVLNRSKQECN